MPGHFHAVCDVEGDSGTAHKSALLDTGSCSERGRVSVVKGIICRRAASADPNRLSKY